MYGLQQCCDYSPQHLPRYGTLSRSFPLLSSIPLNEYSTIYSTILLLMNIGIISYLGLFQINAAMKFWYMYVAGHVYACTYMGIYLAVELLGH